MMKNFTQRSFAGVDHHDPRKKRNPNLLLYTDSQDISKGPPETFQGEVRGRSNRCPAEFFYYIFFLFLCPCTISCQSAVRAAQNFCQYILGRYAEHANRRRRKEDWMQKEQTFYTFCVSKFELASQSASWTWFWFQI